MSGYAVRLRVVDGLNISAHSKPLSLEELQAAVGGLIESLFTIPSPFRSNTGIQITGYVNEEGLLFNLPYRFRVISPDYGVNPFVGDMIIVGLNSKIGKTVLLTKEESDWIQSHFSPTTDNLNLP